jgi:putative transposase
MPLKNVTVDRAGKSYHAKIRLGYTSRMMMYDEEFECAEKILAVMATKFRIELFAYCIMPNHIHLLAAPEKHNEIKRATAWFIKEFLLHIQALPQRGKKKFSFLEHVRQFEVEETPQYFVTTARYIEQNPVRAHYARDPLAWKYSSARAHALKEKRVVKLSHWPVLLPDAYEELVLKSRAFYSDKMLHYCSKSSMPFTSKPRGRVKKVRMQDVV